MCRCFRAFLVASLAPLIINLPAHAETPADAAARVDTMLEQGARNLPALVDDATFLRRVSLDLTGKVPDRQAMQRFVGDTATDKRRRIVEELLIQIDEGMFV